MSNVLSTTPSLSQTRNGERIALRMRLADYLELTKPRIAVMALITVSIGFVLAKESPWDLSKLIESLIGVALVAASSSCFNQVLEHSTDRLMNRTRNRPLAANRLSLFEASLFGGVTLIAGLVWLAVLVNPLTAWLGAVTFLLYVVVYTPLKKISSFNTVVGAIPGALPPVLGWVAAGGALDRSAFALFAILFLWQFPHFMAIAWLYREDYASAGLKMLPSTDARRQWGAGLVAIGYASALLPVSMIPSLIGLSGVGYVVAALFLGLAYLWFSIKFYRHPCESSARQLLLTSLIYLPLLYLILTVDHCLLLS